MTGDEDMSNNVLENRLSPIIKYPGGKEKELNHIIPALPKNIKNYYEPFVGGGAVYFSINAEKYYINDKSDELIMLYRMVKEQNTEFFEKLNAIEYNWNIISEVVDHHKDSLHNIYVLYKKGEINKKDLENRIELFVSDNAEEFNGLLSGNFNYEIDMFVGELCKSIKNKIVRMSKIESEKGELAYDDIVDNIESSLKSAFYSHFRMLMNRKKDLNINDEFSTAIYFFIRQVCYSSMFRYNKEGGFNVPYGGISYNRKSFNSKINYYRDSQLVSHLAKTTIGNMDFYEFMNKYVPQEDDFVFLDPPYDSEFSTYAQNEFDKNDQTRLADYLIKDCKAHFMIVIKNTEYIYSLYKEGMKTANGKKLYVSSFDKKYFVSFQDRNNKNAEHLVITNYCVEGEK